MSYPKKFDVDALILDLSGIVGILKTATPFDKQRFLSNFSDWASQRRNTLAELKKLKTELNDVCLKAKIGKCVGTGVSVVGGLAALIGIGLQLSSDEETRSVGKKIAGCGAGARLLGGAVSATSSGVEYLVNRKLLNEVKLSLKKDQQLTRQLVPYLKKSEDLTILFKNVFDCDLLSDTVKDIFTVVQGVASLYRQGKYAYSQISEAFSYSMNDCSYSLELQKLQRVFQRLGKKAQFVLLEFCENEAVREAVLKIVEATTSSPVILELSKVSARVFFRMFRISKEPGYLSLIGQLAGSAAKSANILLSTVTLALDIVALIALAKDIPDSESKYSGMVEEIELFLLKELNEASLLVNQFKRN